MGDTHTLKDVIDCLMDIREKQAEAGAKLIAIYEDVAEWKDHTKSQNGRIGSLERWRWIFAGGLAVAVFVVKLIMG